MSTRSPGVIELQSYKGQLIFCAAVSVVLLAGAFVLVGWRSPGPNQGIKDQASALVLIGAAAVGIERTLEFLWTFVDSTGSSFWPLSAIDTTINNLVNAITGVSEGPVTELRPPSRTRNKRLRRATNGSPMRKLIWTRSANGLIY